MQRGRQSLAITVPSVDLEQDSQGPCHQKLPPLSATSHSLFHPHLSRNLSQSNTTSATACSSRSRPSHKSIKSSSSLRKSAGRGVGASGPRTMTRLWKRR
ncbi:hypothetical protein DPMN_176307 [Dreissena polymorpha]|uniref:Uncharacterized protein n=1 Tax=Dreissena polymorpha TaxID=45954 RepID=A0A9D4E8U4_DREPO|nr:hypothetical protein DPMN_176307 [Dreissena polymorpha]